MAAQGRGSNLKPSQVGSGKPVHKAAPLPKAPKAASPAFSPNLQSTFKPLGHGVGAPSKLGSPKNQREGAKTSHSILSEIGHGIGKGASTVGHELSLLAQARTPETPSSSAATRELLKPINKGNQALQSPGTARQFATVLRAGGINIDKDTLEKVGKSLLRLPEDIAETPKGTVESVIHPVKAAKDLARLAKETVEHPAEHADFITLLGVPFLHRATGKADITGAMEDTGVGSVKVRPLAKTKGVGSAFRRPSLEGPAKKDLSKRVTGGPIKPGRGDVYVGSQAQFEHLTKVADEEGMARHVSKDKAVNEAIPIYGEGLIKPNDRVGSASKRIAQIREESKDPNLSDKQRLEMDRQIHVYEKIKGFSEKQHKEAIDLSEGHRAYQHPKSEQAAYEGVLKPQQLRARFMGFALTHGDELGRGKLRLAKDKVSPLIGDLAEVNGKIADARHEFESAGNPMHARRMRATIADLEDQRQTIEDHLHNAHGADSIKKLKHDAGRISTEKGSGIMHDHLVDASGKHVPWEEIEKLYYEHGHKNPPLYVSQSSKALQGEGPGKVRGVPRHLKSRTGKNFERGTYDTTLENLRRSNVGMGNEIAKVQGKRGQHVRFSHGEWADGADADKAAKAFNDDPANEGFKERYGPMERTSRGPARFLRSPAGREDPNWLDAGVQAEMRDMRLGPGKFTLQPKKIKDRIEQHEKITELARNPPPVLKQWIHSVTAFKKAVLILNPHWWAGVPLEYMVRGLQGDRPGMKALGEKNLTRWRAVAEDPSMPSHLRYEALRLAASFDQGKTMGGWVGDLLESSNINDIMRPQQSKWGALMDRTPKSLRLYRGAQNGVAKWLHYIEKTNNRKILGQVAYDQVKQTARETRDVVNDLDKLRERWTEGKLDPNEADDLIERLIRVTGNWHHLTPHLKVARMMVLPFGMWTVNALSYLLKVMPRDYPGRTMLLVALSQGAPREDVPLYLKGTLGPVKVFGQEVRPDPYYYLPTSIGREVGIENGKPHVSLLGSTTPLLGAASESEEEPVAFARKAGESIIPAAGQISRVFTSRQGPAIGALKGFGPLRLATPSKKEEEGPKHKKGSLGGSLGKGLGGSLSKGLK